MQNHANTIGTYSTGTGYFSSRGCIDQFKKQIVHYKYSWNQHEYKACFVDNSGLTVSAVINNESICYLEGNEGLSGLTGIFIGYINFFFFFCLVQQMAVQQCHIVKDSMSPWPACRQ